MCYYPECVYAKACEPPDAATTMGGDCKTPDGKVIVFAKTMWPPEGCSHFAILEDPEKDPILRKILEAAKEQGYVRRWLAKLGRTAWVKEDVADWTDDEVIAHASKKPWWRTPWWRTLLD